MPEPMPAPFPPLDFAALPNGRRGLRVVPAEPASRFVFRGGRDAADACSPGFGVPLPEFVCRAAAFEAKAALCLGPDEWLLIARAEDGAAVRDAVAGAVGKLSHSLVEVSDRQIGFDIDGAKARQGLNAGCPLDLDNRAFPVGMCTRTVFAKAEILLWRPDAGRFRLEVFRSFAAYVAGHLAEAVHGLDGRSREAT
jgi:sarcosine oxidase subunit gamma